MYCPNCAAKNSTDQRFCRACGMNLEQTAAMLSEQFPARKPVELERTERRIERFGQIAFGGFGVVLVIGVLGIIYTIISKMIVSGQQPWAGVLLVLFIVFAMLTLAYVVFNEDLKERKKAKPMMPPAVPELDAAEANRLTEGTPMPVPSVVEDTTDLLPVETKTRKL